MTLFYRHPSPTPRIPAWLDGWDAHAPEGVALCQRDTPGGLVVGVCDPVTFDPPTSGWVPLPGATGWECALREPFDPRWLVRHQLWCDIATVSDLAGREWAAPVVLTVKAKRAFRVAYAGPDFLPRLTPAQARAVEVAEAASEELEQLVAANGEGGIDLPIACRWAAALIPVAMHVPEGAFAALGLLDDRLTLATLSVATSIPLKMRQTE